ncbi:MAG: YdbH domain-containing protein [Opitutales bacterium]
MVAALLLLGAGGAWMGERWLPGWVEDAVRARAAAAGMRAEVAVDYVSLGGGALREGEISAEGLEAKFDEAQLGWSLGDLLRGRLETVRVGGLEAALDLARGFPSEGAADASLAVAEQSGARVAEASVGPALLGFPNGNGDDGEGAWWWDMPVGEVSIPAAQVTLTYGPKRLPFLADLEFTRDEAGQRLDFSADNDGGFSVWTTAKSEPAGPDWEVQLDWKGTQPLELADWLLPAGHPWSPRARLPAMVREWSLGPLEFEALAEGEGPHLRTLSLLATQGASEVAWGEGGSVELAASTLGVGMREGRWSQLEAVLDVQKVALEGGHFSPFLLNMGWTPEAPARLEVPSVTWQGDDLMRASAAVRGFLQPGGEAELQVAFSEVRRGELVLAPFRWFAQQNAHHLTARLSPLWLEKTPSWRLVETRFEVRNAPAWRPGSPPPAGQWAVEGQSVLEYQPELRKMLSLAASARPSGEHAVAWEGRVTGELEETLGELEGAVESGGLHFSGTGDWALADFMPYLFPLHESLRALRGDGALHWTLEGRPGGLLGVRTILRVVLNDAALADRQGDWALEGVNGELVFDLQGIFPASRGEQVLRAKRLMVGERALEDVELRFRLSHLRHLEVTHFEGSWMDGEVALQPFVVNPLDPALETEVIFRSIDAGALMAGMGELAVRLEGRLAGRLPLSYRPVEGWQFARGYLRALSSPPAILRFVDRAALQRYLQLPAALGEDRREAVMDDLMRGLAVERLTIDLLNPETPQQPLLLELESRLETPEIVLEGLHLSVPVRVPEGLEGLRAVLLLLSGGTFGR